MSDSSKEGILALAGSLVGFCTIAVGLRIWARRRQKLPLMADDWMAVLALLPFIGSAICDFISVHNKVFGYSTHDFTPEQLQAMDQTDKVSEITHDVLSTTTLAFTKLSALFFYRRIFCAGEKRTKFSIATWITIVVVILWLAIFQFLTGFQCGTHFSALWDGSYSQYCTLSFPFLYGLTISDFILDVWILTLPIPCILRLHATLKRKLSIIGVFLFALIGLGASIARMVQYIKVELGGPDYLLYTDYEHLITQAIFYTTMEAGLGLIAVNLPSLRVFSISFKTWEVTHSVRSLVELSFLRGRSSSNIGRNATEPSTTGGAIDCEKPESFSTRPSGSSHVLHRGIPETSLSFLEDPESQYRSVARG